jgi:hypothetical protein
MMLQIGDVVSFTWRGETTFAQVTRLERSGRDVLCEWYVNTETEDAQGRTIFEQYHTWLRAECVTLVREAMTEA